MCTCIKKQPDITDICKKKFKKVEESSRLNTEGSGGLHRVHIYNAEGSGGLYKVQIFSFSNLIHMYYSSVKCMISIILVSYFKLWKEKFYCKK